MLTKNGKLTDIGSWYLGGVHTGNKPSAAGRMAVCASSVGVAVLASFWTFF